MIGNQHPDDGSSKLIRRCGARREGDRREDEAENESGENLVPGAPDHRRNVSSSMRSSTETSVKAPR
jgi:hypothetical protein